MYMYVCTHSSYTRMYNTIQVKSVQHFFDLNVYTCMLIILYM